MSACSSASSSLSFSSSVNVWLLIKRAMLRAVFSCLVTDLMSPCKGISVHGSMITVTQARVIKLSERLVRGANIRTRPVRCRIGLTPQSDVT